MLDKDDTELILKLAGSSGCSLATTAKKDNWVDKAGHLPNYICRIAKAVMRSGKSRGSAIAIAVSRVKVWAGGGGGVDADTRAKAAKAVAQWTALKAKSKSLVKATNQDDGFLMLSNVGSFNTDIVRGAWDARESAKRREYASAHPSSNYGDIAPAPYAYIRELWTDYIIVQHEDPEEGICYYKIPYHVENDEVVFGDETKVEQSWEEADDDYELSAYELGLLHDVVKLSKDKKALDRIMGLVDKS